MERADDGIRIVNGEGTNCHLLDLGSAVALCLSASSISEGVKVRTLP